ncbi:MAG: RluA family pseudouridine synthase [Ghiorsea sp.]
MAWESLNCIDLGFYELACYPSAMNCPETLEQMILFEDTRFLIMNKPSGLAVHGVKDGNLGLIEQLREFRSNAPYLELAHRLDRDTSGCLVIAKRKSALRAFQKQQESRGVDKHYLALIQGVWTGGFRKVDAPLLKENLQSGGWSVRVDKKGKRSVSYFSPVEKFKHVTLVRVKIITGRTHQIRVHAQHIGQPIAGDSKYGDAQFNVDIERQGLNRLYLHAESIQFTLPDLEPYHIQAPISHTLQTLLTRLKKQ